MLKNVKFGLANIKELPEDLTPNTAGGASRALGQVYIACELLPEGGFESVVMPETPSVISVGERCMAFGYGFYWPLWSQKPYLTTPAGGRVDLTMFGRIPYL